MSFPQFCVCKSLLKKQSGRAVCGVGETCACHSLTNLTVHLCCKHIEHNPMEQYSGPPCKKDLHSIPGLTILQASDNKKLLDALHPFKNCTIMDHNVVLAPWLPKGMHNCRLSSEMLSCYPGQRTQMYLCWNDRQVLHIRAHTNWLSNSMDLSPFSLLCSQEPFTGPCPEPDESTPHHPILFL
jgi:hypothetical protein